MTDRQSQRARDRNIFLNAHGWGDATCDPLADDASFRCYYRLCRAEDKAILMDAPPEFEDIRPFMAIASHLHHIGLAAPKIFAHNEAQGFLLLEDMGDALFTHVIDRDPDQENALYRLATEGLLKLHAAPPDLPQYDMDMLLMEVSLFADWYLPAIHGKSLSDARRSEFLALCRELLLPVSRDLTCLTLRDYHGENLMLKQGQAGLDRLGLLDFQDAVIGHPAYDLVSLLQDARRDVSPGVEQEMLAFYWTETGMNETEFHRDYAILGAQRHMKIIGIFTRLYLRDGKEAYLRKIPRVWGLLERNLQHTALTSLNDWLAENVAPSLRQQKFTAKSFMPSHAMILAAGLGKRMRPLSNHCPKPLVKVADRELISYSLDGLCAAGVRNIVVNKHSFADQMTAYLNDYYDHRLTIYQSDESAQLMDSGGGVKQAIQHLGNEPFLVLNSDMIWRDGNRQMLHRMQAFWRADEMDILMLLLPREEAFGFDGAGDYHRDAKGRLTARAQDAQAGFVYSGIMIIKPDSFADTPDGPFSLRQQFDRAEQQGRLYGVVHDGAWYHVGTPETRDQVEEILSQDG